MTKVSLHRNLRRQILRGHPWIYKDALEFPKDIQKVDLCKVLDNKKNFVAWGLLDPMSDLAVRVYSVNEKRASLAFEDSLLRAWDRRKHLLKTETTGFRWVNGEGDQLPGLVLDYYDGWVVLQGDGPSMEEFWKSQWIQLKSLPLKTLKGVYLKSRNSENSQWLTESDGPAKVEFQENGALFVADIKEGQKTGFFFDQRDNRFYIRQISEGKKVLNLFSYTGGFSVSAGLGEAFEVTSVDLAKPAISYCSQHWEMNKLNSPHVGLAQDVFKYLEESKELFDVVIVDPPSMARSEAQKKSAVVKYTDLFASSLKKLSPQGHWVVSSCSSHIPYDLFMEIINEALSKSRKTARILKIGGQGEDHPFPAACPELRYLKLVHLQLY